MNIVNKAIPALMSATEFAAFKGVGKSAVSNWKRKCLLVFAEDAQGGKPKIHVERTEQRLAAHVDPSRGRPTTAQTSAEAPAASSQISPAAARGDGLGEVRTDLIRAQTVQMQMKNARAAGELVLLADYESRAADYGRLVRERIGAVIRTNSERIAAETDPRMVTSILQSEFDAAMLDLAKSMTGGAPALADDDDALARIEAADEADEGAATETA